MMVRPVPLDAGDAQEIHELFGFLIDLCDDQREALSFALDGFTAYGYHVGELRADVVRLAASIEQAMQ